LRDSRAKNPIPEWRFISLEETHVKDVEKRAVILRSEVREDLLIDNDNRPTTKRYIKAPSHSGL
jgi:hypothetical protein